MEKHPQTPRERIQASEMSFLAEIQKQHNLGRRAFIALESLMKKYDADFAKVDSPDQINSGESELSNFVVLFLPTDVLEAARNN
jgi:hypothetical protein